MKIIITPVDSSNKPSFTNPILSILLFIFMANTNAIQAQDGLQEMAEDSSEIILRERLKKQQDSVDFLSFDGEYNKAITLSIENIALAEKVGDSGAAYYSRYSIAILHLYLEEYEDMLRYIEPYKAFALRNNDTLRMGRAYNLEGSAYISMKNFEKGIPIIKKAIPLFKKLKDTLQTTISYYNAAESYLNMGDNSKAQVYFDSTTTSLNSMKGFKGLTTEYNILSGRIKMVNNNPKGALENFDTAIDFALRGGYIDTYLVEAYKKSSEALFSLGRPVEAYNTLIKYDSINKTLFEKDKIKMIENAKAKFDTEQYKAQATKADLENRLNEERLENQKKLSIVLVIFGVIILVLLGFLFNSYKKRKA